MTYRTGNTVPNTLYEDDTFIGSAITGYKASELVRLANLGLEVQAAQAGERFLAERQSHTAPLDGGE